MTGVHGLRLWAIFGVLAVWAAAKAADLTTEGLDALFLALTAAAAAGNIIESAHRYRRRNGHRH